MVKSADENWIFEQKLQNFDLEWTGFELGISDYQTDALDHSASLDDIQNSEKCHTYTQKCIESALNNEFWVQKSIHFHFESF